VVDAVIVMALHDYLAGFGGWVTLIQGVIFIACMLIFRARHGRRARASPERTILRRSAAEQHAIASGA
jgi:hypothetical protein